MALFGIKENIIDLSTYSLGFCKKSVGWSKNMNLFQHKQKSSIFALSF